MIIENNESREIPLFQDILVLNIQIVSPHVRTPNSYFHSTLYTQIFQSFKTMFHTVRNIFTFTCNFRSRLSLISLTLHEEIHNGLF